MRAQRAQATTARQGRTTRRKSPPKTEGSDRSTATRVVLDTSVLVADPQCLGAYPGCDIVIPLTVIEELDGLKSRPDDVGRSARAALRHLEEIRLRAGGSLAAPVATDDVGSTVHIEINGIQRHLLVEHGLDPAKPDNRIIGSNASNEWRANPANEFPRSGSVPSDFGRGCQFSSTNAFRNRLRDRRSDVGIGI